MSRFFLFLQILLLGVILAPSSLNAQKGDQQLKRKFSNESTRIRIPISSANSDLNNQEVFQTKWINNSPSEILDILLVEKSVEKEGILYPSQQMMDRIWLTLLASVDPIADSSGGDDTGGGDNAKRGLVPLPKPDSNPNGAGPDDVLKISDEAACVAKGGVWVSRGDTGFCYLKIKAEEPPELEPIDDNDSGGPAWNNGWSPFWAFRLDGARMTPSNKIWRNKKKRDIERTSERKGKLTGNRNLKKPRQLRRGKNHAKKNVAESREILPQSKILISKPTTKSQFEILCVSRNGKHRPNAENRF